MYANFLLFLFVISACDVQCATSDSYPLRMALCDAAENFHKVFQYDDARTAHVQYHWEGVKKPHSGVLTIRNKEEQKNLSIVMDYDKDLYTLLQTQICYRHSASEKKVATASSVLYKNLSPTEQKGTGSVKIVSPGHNNHVVWPIVVYELSSRPELCATVTANNNGLNLTRYVFHAEGDCEAFFVRVCIQYKNLHMAHLSWGTERFCGVVAHGDKANLALAGEQTVNFWQ